jgi:hypothetical protein
MEPWLRGVYTTDGGWPGSDGGGGAGFAELTVEAQDDGGVGQGGGLAQLTVAGRDDGGAGADFRHKVARREAAVST